MRFSLKCFSLIASAILLHLVNADVAPELHNSVALTATSVNSSKSLESSLALTSTHDNRTHNSLESYGTSICPFGMFVEGVTVWTGSLVDSYQLTCSDGIALPRCGNSLPSQSSWSNSAGYTGISVAVGSGWDKWFMPGSTNGCCGGNGGTYQALLCPSGQLMKGITVATSYSSASMGPPAINCGTPCPIGNYCTNNQQTLCPTRTFQNEYGRSTCKNCPAYSTAGVGSSSCTCDSGSYGSPATGLISSGCTQCPVGTYTDGWGKTSCTNCAAGTYASSIGSTSCLSCSAGSSSPAKASSCTLCLPGEFSSTKGKATCSQCSPGYYSPSAGSTQCTACPAGSYSPGSGASQCITCSEGFYCPAASSAQIACPAGTISPAGKSSCIACPAGTFIPTSDNSRTQCYNCATGYIAANAGMTSCTVCPSGTYSDGSNYINGIYATSCKLCQASAGGGVSSTVVNPSFNWEGGPTASQCICSVGWTGTNCEYSKCSTTLIGGSLGSILFNADPKLNQYASNASAYNIVDVGRYVMDFIRVGIDVDGDGVIYRSEFMTALKYRKVYSTGMSALPVWCQNATATSYCYADQDDSVPTMSIFADAMKNFRFGPFRNFDGSGVAALTNIKSTYPHPSWTDKQCQAYDRSVNSSAFITTRWNIESNPSIKRVCGYINGVLSSDFSTTAVLSGAKTVFDDKLPSSPSIDDKRVYCVAVELCATGSTLIDYICYAPCPAGSSISSASSTQCTTGGVASGRPIARTTVSYECAVGLVYNGSPIDLAPKLTRNGVTFMFTDTSSSETQFDIYVGEMMSSNSDKTHVVNILSGLGGCGRTANPISFADEISALSVGQVVEYGISATQTWNAGAYTAPTNLTLFPYRIPFLVTISGKVSFESGEGVGGVTVTLCHIDSVTKKPDLNADFCPIVAFTTDLFGAFSGEIRVSNRGWTNLVEYFSVHAEYEQVLADGSVISHTFSPTPLQALSHAVGTALFEITDTTETRVYGSTVYDIGGYNCPLPGVLVELTRDSGEIITTNSASDGTFDFTVTLGEPVKLRIPSFNGHTWSSSWQPLTATTSRRLQAISIPSANPTSFPSLQHMEEAELLHRFTFDNVNVVNNKLIPDIIDPLQNAAMMNGLSSELSNVNFFPSSNRNSQPFLMLPTGIFGVSDVVSIEFWASFDTTNNPQAKLFSFGDKQNNISISTAAFVGLANVYITVIINPPKGIMQLFVNGILSSSIGISHIPALSGTDNYIGWDRQKTTPGLSGKIDEIRIWAGELSNTTMANSLIQGCDPTYIELSSTAMIRPVQVSYKVTSKAKMQIGFFGGLSQSPMFGPESSFVIQSLDPQCGYKVELTLADTSRVNRLLPAMNYSVTLQPFKKSIPSPSFSGSNCASSLDPYSFLSSTDQLSQDLYVDLQKSSVLNATFIYRSGLCMDVIGSKNFSTVVSAADKDGLVCYSAESTILNKGSTRNLSISLFELYPSSSAWLTAPTTALLSSDTEISKKDLMIPDSGVDVSDLVSGISSIQSFVYAASAETLTTAPPALNYTIIAGDPRPSPPFALPFQVFATRLGPEGPSRVIYSAFIPILGLLASEVPDLYPVSTSENLIFMVLRDPPGGGSFSTIHAGTTFSTAVSIEGMRTFETSAFGSLGGGAAVKIELDASIAPLGFGAVSSLADVEGRVGGSGTFEGPAVTATRISGTHYEYSFSFGYDFSTSTDPNIAGHPSDVIIGGGVDVIVALALEVSVNRTTRSQTCIQQKTVATWLPGAVTTYALPVIEIEILITKLSDLVVITASGNDSSNNAGKLSSQLNNWKSILSTYRAHNEDLTEMFTADTLHFNEVISQYAAFTAGQLSADDFVAALDTGTTYDSLAFVGGSGPTKSYVKSLNNAFNSISKTCDEVLPTSRSSYLSTVCDDFDSKLGTWQSFAKLIMGACNMPEDGSTADPLRSSTLFQSMCKTSSSPGASVIPGGLTGSTQDESLFAFMGDSKKLVTFGANSPVTMSWTSTVSDSKSFVTEFSVQKSLTSQFDFDLQVTALVGAYATATGGSTNAFTLSLGKSSESSHSSERTVTVTLDDPDSGDYFAVRVTEDPVYATPVFTTMGGASKCPGETATTRRESGVRIVQIVPRCGPDKNLPCDATTTNTDDWSGKFAVLIENLSPSREPVDYTLRLKPAYDDYNTVSAGVNGAYQCGQSGQISDLSVQFSNTDLLRIPYSRYVEVQFSVHPTAGVPLCQSYNDIQVEIIATCEVPTSSSYVYQYGVAFNSSAKKVQVLYDSPILAQSSAKTASFSIAYPPTTTKRRLKSDGEFRVNPELEEMRSTMKTMLGYLSFLMLLFVLLFAILLIVTKILFDIRTKKPAPLPSAITGNDHSKGYVNL